ncbi:ABC transporter ATP-binding protein [Ochrobactrum sp. CM-21-5]|nr:ABC transporter ATP-binding protein [Ochrobactrum sp. CM-21-5]MBC2885739.1 ABC transporter ATP-binding protein [Ochrobactrum sp. CM-21-5]
MVTATHTPILRIRNLSIATTLGKPVVSDINLDVSRGEVVAVIGASGSGKTTLALAALGRLRPGLTPAGGSIELEGIDMLAAPERQLNALRGRRVAYVAQSAAASFNPRHRLQRQVIESALLHGSQTREEAMQRAKDTFALLNLPVDKELPLRFPHQVSGGQLQRFMIAMAMQEEPLLLICDEPTSALDVTTQLEVITQLKQAIAAKNTAALFISHDLAVVAQLASRIAVMHRGRLVECGTADQILNAPRETYTRELLAACTRFPKGAAPAPTEASRAMAAPALLASQIVAGYGPVIDGRPQLTVLSDISLAIDPGEIVALIGESGSGKSTFARVVAGLLPAASGTMHFGSQPLPAAIQRRSAEQRRRIQLVYQSADTALNPRMSARRILGRTLQFYGGLRGAQASTRMIELLRLVHLPPEYLDRTPMQLSGGEKQRLNLARALAADPTLLICDEITSALDTIVAKGIIDLIRDLRQRLGISVLFISHDLATVSSLADRVAVLRDGRQVETGSTAPVLSTPSHPYTRLLVASVPQLRTDWLEDAATQRDVLVSELNQQEISSR